MNRVALCPSRRSNIIKSEYKSCCVLGLPFRGLACIGVSIAIGRRVSIWQQYILGETSIEYLGKGGSVLFDLYQYGLNANGNNLAPFWFGNSVPDCQESLVKQDQLGENCMQDSSAVPKIRKNSPDFFIDAFDCSLPVWIKLVGDLFKRLLCRLWRVFFQFGKRVEEISYVWLELVSCKFNNLFLKHGLKNWTMVLERFFSVLLIGTTKNKLENEKTNLQITFKMDCSRSRLLIQKTKDVFLSGNSAASLYMSDSYSPLTLDKLIQNWGITSRCIRLVQTRKTLQKQEP